MSGCCHPSAISVHRYLASLPAYGRPAAAASGGMIVPGRLAGRDVRPENWSVCGRQAVAVLTLVLVSIVTACASRPESAQPGKRAAVAATSTAPHAGRAFGGPGCHPASPVTRWQSFLPQVEGTGHGATLWGLLMFPHPLPARVGDQEKIVWRMTGTGLLTLEAIGPDASTTGWPGARTPTSAVTGTSPEVSGARAMSLPRRAAGICAPSVVPPPRTSGFVSLAAAHDVTGGS